MKHFVTLHFSFDRSQVTTGFPVYVVNYLLTIFLLYVLFAFYKFFNIKNLNLYFFISN